VPKTDKDRAAERISELTKHDRFVIWDASSSLYNTFAAARLLALDGVQEIATCGNSTGTSVAGMS
jgi:hypothetical protein